MTNHCLRRLGRETMLIFLAATLPLLFHETRAQEGTTNATCYEEFDWVCFSGSSRFCRILLTHIHIYSVQMRNSLGQSPCLVTAWLSVPCNPDRGEIQPPRPFSAPVSNLSFLQGWFVRGPLLPGHFYGGPSTGSNVIPCHCNTVLYSTYAACAYCQRHTDNLGIAEYVRAFQDANKFLTQASHGTSWTFFTENCPTTELLR